MGQGFKIVHVAAGEVLWSVYPSHYEPTSFNPNTTVDPASADDGARFSPFENAQHQRVPSKYLADHPNGAFAETLLRDDMISRTVSINAIETHHIARLKLKHKFQVIDLSQIQIGKTISEWMRLGRVRYPSFRTLAADLYERYPAISGIRWDGKQMGSPGMICFVLFERESLVLELEVQLIYPLTEGEGLHKLRAAAAARDFMLPEKYAIGPISRLPAIR